MKQTAKCLMRAVCLLSVCALVFLAWNPADAKEQKPLGHIVQVVGSGQVINKALNRELAARKGMALHVGDQIKTGPDSNVKIMLNDESLIRVGAESTFEMEQFEYDTQGKVRDAKFSLPAGKVKILVNDLFGYKERRFEVETPTAIAGVRGTLWAVVVISPGRTMVVSYDNLVKVMNKAYPGQPVDLSGGSVTFVDSDKPPSPPTPITPEVEKALAAAFPPPTTEPSPTTTTAGATTTTSGATTTTAGATTTTSGATTTTAGATTTTSGAPTTSTSSTSTSTSSTSTSTSSTTTSSTTTSTTTTTTAAPTTTTTAPTTTTTTPTTTTTTTAPTTTTTTTAPSTTTTAPTTTTTTAPTTTTGAPTTTTTTTAAPTTTTSTTTTTSATSTTTTTGGPGVKPCP